MTERHDTVIVGGGQAGLAMSYHLRERGREHVILERSRIGERWRSERWASLCFQFPNSSLTLPGVRYRGDAPDAFAHHTEITRFVDDYAALIDAPVRCGITVKTLERDPRSGRYLIATGDGTIEAERVILATGPFQRPRIPDVSKMLSPEITQLHASAYRDPDQLPPGAVLVVGTGSSGCQIAEELHGSNRTVYLSVGRHQRVRRRYRGRDIMFWLVATGRFDRTLDSFPGRVMPPPLLITGADGGHDIDLRRCAGDGMVLVGRVTGADASTVFFADDVNEVLALADRSAADFDAAVEAYVRDARDDAFDEADPEPPVPVRLRDFRTPSSLHLDDAGITSVIWCTGYAFDLDWVHVPVFDDRGAPVQQRGVTSADGLYFLGLHWMHTFKSGTLFGVGNDAAYLASHLAQTAAS